MSFLGACNNVHTKEETDVGNACIKYNINTQEEIDTEDATIKEERDAKEEADTQYKFNKEKNNTKQEISTNINNKETCLNLDRTNNKMDNENDIELAEYNNGIEVVYVQTETDLSSSYEKQCSKNYKVLEVSNSNEQETDNNFKTNILAPRNKSYDCNIRIKRFASSSLLSQHLLTSHLVHGKFNLISSDVTMRTNLQETNVAGNEDILEVIAEDKSVGLKEKRFTCSTCDQVFTTRGSANQHYLIHTGCKAFKCLVCDRRFNKKSYLTVHMRRHTGERYKCQSCRECFSLEEPMKKHIMTVHAVPCKSLRS